MSGKLVIWGRTSSSNVQKVMWLCTELGVEYERIDAGLAFGRNKDPDYLAMNPNGLIPVVQDGDTTIWESNTIMRYIADTRGGEAFYPRDPAARSQVDRWLDWQVGTMAPAISPLFMGLIRTPPERRDPAAIEASRAQTAALWTVLDGQLAHRAHVASDAFSLADIALGNSVHRWYSFAIERPHLPHVEAWHRRLAGHAAFRDFVAQPVV